MDHSSQLDVAMLGRLLILFLVTPVVELALLIQLGEYIGFWPTIGIILLTGLTGSYLAKREGLSVWRRFNERMKIGELPGKELLDGVIILMAGALLITPGVLTDVVGFIGLIPFTRSILRKHVNRRIQKGIERGSLRLGFGGFQSFGGSDFGEFGGTDSGDIGGETGRTFDTDRPESGSGRRTNRSRDDGADQQWGGRPRDVPGYNRDES